MALKVKPHLAAIVVGTLIAVLAVIGVLQRTAFPQWGFANLDSEVSIATWFSSALLWLTALWWLLVALNVQPRSIALWAWWLILVWLALDEGNGFHERLERWTGLDWQLLYLPVIAVAGTAWIFIVRRFRDDPHVVRLLFAGAGAWAVTLLLELGQNWGGEPVRASIYNPTMVLEETLEMIGSTLLLLAGMYALSRIRTSERS